MEDRKLFIHTLYFVVRSSNSLRNESPQDESGWYLITDDYNDDIKSLKMVHFSHVAFARPDILKYLAIPLDTDF